MTVESGLEIMRELVLKGVTGALKSTPMLSLGTLTGIESHHQDHGCEGSLEIEYGKRQNDLEGIVNPNKMFV